MSTQRRESRWRRPAWTGRAGGAGQAIPVPSAPCASAGPGGGTAPPGLLAWCHPSDQDLSPGAPVGLATNSLPSGYRIVQLVPIVLIVQSVWRDRRQSPPASGSGSGSPNGTPASHGSTPTPIPHPSGRPRLHPTLPQIPVGRRRRAERYDGKGNLHLLHAA